MMLSPQSELRERRGRQASSLFRAPYEKTLFTACHRRTVSALEVNAGEAWTHPSTYPIASLVFRGLGRGFTYLAWYALVQRYSANRLAAVTFLTPLFGVAAGYLILDEPLTPRFLTAVAMVTLGTLLPRIPVARALRSVRSRLPPRQR